MKLKFQRQKLLQRRSEAYMGLPVLVSSAVHDTSKTKLR